MKRIELGLLKNFQVEGNPLAINGFIVSSTSLMDKLKDVRLGLSFEEIIKWKGLIFMKPLLRWQK